MIRRIVIYTRYSSDMQRQESGEDQEREVRRGLERLGIDARDALVLHDRAESGTRSDRTHFERLRDMVARGEVAVLAVDDQSRLSRADDACSFITDVVFKGGRFVSTGEGIDTEVEGWQLKVKVMELHHSTTIRELGRRVHRGQKGRVLDDGAAGDHPYGYESYYLDPDGAAAQRRGPKPKKALRIKESEADWVRQVFAWFVGGMSIAASARELTRLGVDKGSRSTRPGWHHAQVRRMLGNAKYAGTWAWGMTKVLRSSGGKTKQVPVADDQQVVRDRPDLRIIDPATWERAQARLCELGETFGVKPGDGPRGPRVHHTSVYPGSLLGGLVSCRLCGSRMWARASGGRDYLGCPGHAKGLCAMSTQVPVDRAEAAILGLVAEVLTSWPGWVESACAAMRRAVAEAAEALPEALRADRGRLADLDRRIKNLLDQLEGGAGQGSPAIRARLDELEREADGLRRRAAEATRLGETALAMPDNSWIKGQLSGLAGPLGDEPGRAALLLRSLLGRVEAEGVVAPGKVRGFARLRIGVDAGQLLARALEGRLPGAILDHALPSKGSVEEFVLDLGSPTRRDELAPAIAAMCARGVTWPEIGRETGLGTGNAYNVWKRWVGAGAGEDRDSA